MLVELYIEALLVDEELADVVWEAWDVGLIPDDLAALAWLLLLNERPLCTQKRTSDLRWGF